MIKLKPGEPDPEILAFQKYNLADGPPPLNDAEVQLGEFAINDRTKNADQRAAALRALHARDRRSFNAIMAAKDWVAEKPISYDEVAGYSDRIDRIRNQDTRERAHAALRERDRARLDQLLKEGD